ncbi:hypothetical protein [Burkholderia cepacia]|uniref:hypothetical protein n=1 Tax=Burkholderia cepacia TaxID=292 RepID=UPI0015763108|nr:hypothetical protein [Burkholderia cepacia]
MKKVTVIVKGQAGSGHVRVLTRIHQLLMGGSMSGVTLGKNAQAEVGGIADVQIELELEQEPRVPSEGMTLTDEEILAVQTMRGVKRTGYHLHTDSKSGQFYYWSWGAQPDGHQRDAILAADPQAAADKFLALFEPRNGRNNHWQPVRLKTAA